MRLAAHMPRQRSERAALLALALLLSAGIALRLALMAAQRPAFVGYPDVGTYIASARGQLFGDPLRPAGYPEFLRLVHALSAKLSVTIVLQHALGVGSALLLYGAVRRAGFSRWAALPPAAVILLGGSQAFLEHTPLSETLFTFLVAAAVYAASRLAERPSLPWAAAAGLLLALAAGVRVVGVVLAPLLVVWIAVGAGAQLRRRLAAAAAALGVAALALGGYVILQNADNGHLGLSPRAGSWNLYGRVAPFADCSKFDPPAGTRALCERTPPSRRPPPGRYVFDTTYSPGMKHLRGPFVASDADNAKIGAFARAAVVGQPLDYLATVAKAMRGYVAPATAGLREGSSYDYFFHVLLFNPTDAANVRAFALGWYGAAGHGARVNQGLLDALLRYETITELKGPLFVLLALLSLASPFVVPRGRRSAAVLFALVAWALLVAPVAAVWWDARQAVPAFGPLAASAGIGGWGLWRLAHRRGLEQAERGRGGGVP